VGANWVAVDHLSLSCVALTAFINRPYTPAFRKRLQHAVRGP
jgi:hypothetical protein